MAPAAQSRDVLRRLLLEVATDYALGLTVIDQIGRLGLKELLPSLLEMVPDADEETLIALARALGSLGDASAEEVLIARMETAGPGAFVAIIRALGHLASASAVTTLLPFTHGLDQPGEIKALAREAIERIRSRLPGAAQGQLSLSDIEESAGTLSLTDDAGSLSIPEKKTMAPEKKE